MRFRALNKWYANLCGYFWLPCDRCKQEYGGHEAPLGFPHWVVSNDEGGIDTIVCPDCNDELDQLYSNKLRIE